MHQETCCNPLASLKMMYLIVSQLDKIFKQRLYLDSIKLPPFLVVTVNVSIR